MLTAAMLLAGGLASLGPPAVYGFVIAGLNRRRHATLVPGSWDFVGVLFAVSGFLGYLGPLAVVTCHTAWKPVFARSLVGSLLGGDAILALMLALYATAVVGIVARILTRRRNSTAVYNVDPDKLRSHLGELAHGLDGSLRVHGERHYLGLPCGERAFTLTAAPALRHATIAWGPGPASVRERFERALAVRSADWVPEVNPVAGWALAIASVFNLALLASVVLVASWVGPFRP